MIIVEVGFICICINGRALTRPYRTLATSSSFPRRQREPCKATAIHSCLKTPTARVSSVLSKLQDGQSMISHSLTVSPT